MKKTIFTLLGALAFTVSFAQTWNQVIVPTTEKLNDIEFASNTVGYISGDNETLLKTTDGGETWTSITPSGISVPFTYNIGDLDFISETIGFCNVPNAGQTYKTVDGGINWSLIDDVELGNFCYRTSIYAFAENNYLLGGAGCFQSAMFKEFNAGVWSEKNDEMENFNSSEFVAQIDFFNQLGIAATNSNYMLRTVDGGQNWDTISTPISATGVLTSVVITSAMEMYAGYDENGGGFGILKSVDAGLTWTEDINSATFFYPAYLSVAVSANGDFYSGARPFSTPGGLMFETTDGVNWNYEMVDQPIFSIDSYGSDMTFAVGDSGYVITNVEFSSLGLYEQSQMEFQAYPNPTNGGLLITSNLNIPYTIEILDAQFKVIDMISENVNSANIDISACSNGIYFIKMKSEKGQYLKRIIKR